MTGKILLSAAALLALMAATPVAANVIVSLSPQESVIPAVGETTTVDIRATFTDGIIGWGLDVQVDQPDVANLIGYTFGPLWDGGVSIDGDGLSAISDPALFPAGVGPGSDILLATLTFQAVGEGATPILLYVSGDEDEGFALSDLTGNDAVTLGSGMIVVPEPASLLLLSLGGLALLRRR
jgi:hypothetical protein